MGRAWPKPGGGMSKVTGLVVLLLLAACGTPGTYETESNSGPPDASILSKKVCNQFVEKQLRNPLSADFKGLAGMGGFTTRRPGLTPQWTVTSHVDVKTDFGITKRIAFECTVEYMEGDRWKLIDLDLTDLGVK